MLGSVVFGHQQMQAAIKAINDLADEAAKRPGMETRREGRSARRAHSRAFGERPARGVQAQAKAGPLRGDRRDMKRVFEAVGVGAEGGPEANAVKDICFALERRSSAIRFSTESAHRRPRYRARCARSTLAWAFCPHARLGALHPRRDPSGWSSHAGHRPRRADHRRADGEYKERFMLHYNMPPYATGETGRMGSPKRREIGHGRLAKRALAAMLPTAEEFAYSMRVSRRSPSPTDPPRWPRSAAAALRSWTPAFR